MRAAVLLCALVAVLIVPSAALALETSSTSSQPSTNPITLGQSLTDAATISGDGVIAPAGTVSFSACGPGATDCPSGGTAVGTAQTLTPNPDFTSSATSGSFTPNAAGSWCFRADYSGDGVTYDPSSDGSTGECVTVDQATPTVSSSPENASVPLSDPNADTVKVAGNDTGGAPTGQATFSVCGPVTTPSGCASGGQAVGGAVSLTPGSDDTSTATSPPFTATAAGYWCFRADYKGDTNYAAASDGSMGECFVVPQPGAPTATIASPHDNAIYAVGQGVTANYSCSDASTGPGISSCSGPVPSGSPIDTSTLGVHDFTVTATSKDTMSTAVPSQYTVAAAPSATITSPKDGATYTLGSVVSVGFGCSEGHYGSGLAFCNAPSGVDTNRLGTHAFSVTAGSTDGQQSTSTVHYKVAPPSNLFQVSKLKARQTGLVSFSLAVPGGGKVAIVETAPRSALPKGKPKPGRLTLASLKLNPKAKTTLRVTVKPNATGRSLVKHHRSTVKVRLAITFTPVNGKPRTRQFSGLRVSR